MASSQVLASILPGSLIAGRYTVEHALGKGGMGTVYAVRDVSTGRNLALKYLQRQAAEENGSAAALFQREYHTLAHLRHPRVIQVHDYGVDSGRPYFTMELLDGSDLRELAPLPWPRACRLLRDVASSLALLHSRRLLHRDLSPRNVRCTRDGQAKLLDFGTMSPMGVAKDVAGTPPYMAPEAVHGQALDARTDLYALGALAYWTLTGYDAYPARDARELRQLWPRAVLPPSAVATGIPEALDALVMSLLSLDPQARPSHVAEVIERLSAIADLQPIDQLEVARAYLTSPTLVGHTETVASFHKRLVRATRGRGSSALIVGGAGSGRSRLLQAFVLEAKLAGIQVLTADAEDAQRGELGVVRALVDGLIEGAPDVALATFGPHAAVLGGLFPALYRRLPERPALAILEDSREQLARVLHEVREWLAEVSRRRPLMIAVDDADHADQWSLVCLTLLSGDARVERMVLAVSVERTSHKALEVLATEAAHIELPALDTEQNTRLLRSVFGDVPQLQVVADWIHGLSQGNPRTVMELAQYLVDHRIARYERGSFTLPETLRDQALPESIEQAQDELIAALSPPARGLAEGLSLVSDQGHLELDEIVRLSSLRSADQTYGAVDELVAAQVLVTLGSKHHLRQRGLGQALQRGLTAERRCLLHLRLAAVYETRTARGHGIEMRLLSAYHRYLGGDMQACLSVLGELGFASDASFGRTPEAIEMYEACLAHAEAVGLPPHRLYPLRKTLLWLASTADPAMIKHAGPTLTQLCRDSGRVYFEELSDEADPMARIRRCMERARHGFERGDAASRGLAPVEAIHELGACVLMLTETYVLRNDAEALARLPELIEPFRPLSPVLGLLRELASHALDGLAGKNVSDRRLAMLAKLEMPLEGIDRRSQHAIRCGLSYWLGMDEAAIGKASALDRAAELERQPLYAPLGAQVRCTYHLFSGNEDEVEIWQRRRERLALQSPSTDLASTQGILYEAYGYFMCGSVLGMRRVLAAAVKLAAKYPGWQAHLRTIEGLYALLRGEPAVALPLLDAKVATAARVQALLALGRGPEAFQLAQDSLAGSERELDHPVYLYRMRAARALARGANGEAAAAARALDSEIDRAEAAGVSGMLLCAMHEASARLAIEMDDRNAFRQHIRKLGATYGRGASALRARYEQLGVAARRALLSMPPAQPAPRSVSVVESSDVRPLLESAMSRPERLLRALTALADHAKCARGFLFGMQSSGLRLAATVGQGPPPEGLDDMLAFYLSAELDSVEATSSSAAGSVTGTFTSGPDMIAWINDGHSLYYPVLLSCMQDGRRLVGGVAVLALAVQRDPKLPIGLVSEISCVLIESGDVVGVHAAD
jgi:hypothetical protein